MRAFVRTPHRFLPATVTGALGLAVISLLPALIVGHVTPTVVALAALCIARLALDRRDPSGDGARQRDAALILASLLIIYLAIGRTLPSRDTVPARYLLLAIPRERSFYLDAFRLLHAECVPYYLTLAGRHNASTYPVGAALLALPFYAAAARVLGSGRLSVRSQALWQHGSSQLGFAGALCCLPRGRRQPACPAVAGLPLAFAMIARSTDALIAAPLAGLHRARTQLLGTSRLRGASLTLQPKIPASLGLHR